MNVILQLWTAAQLVLLIFVQSPHTGAQYRLAFFIGSSTFQRIHVPVTFPGFLLELTTVVEEQFVWLAIGLIAAIQYSVSVPVECVTHLEQVLFILRADVSQQMRRVRKVRCQY